MQSLVGKISSKMRRAARKERKKGLGHHPKVRCWLEGEGNMDQVSEKEDRAGLLASCSPEDFNKS